LLARCDQSWGATEVNHRTFRQPYVHLITTAGLEARTLFIDTLGFAIVRQYSMSHTPRFFISPRNSQLCRVPSLASAFPYALQSISDSRVRP
jgi:hypothetical protein